MEIQYQFDDLYRQNIDSSDVNLANLIYKIGLEAVLGGPLVIKYAVNEFSDILVRTAERWDNVSSRNKTSRSKCLGYYASAECIKDNFRSLLKQQRSAGHFSDLSVRRNTYQTD